jgi:DNA-binding NarL/FixJ family response regulator
MMPTQILLADDHAILRRGLRRILESYSEFVIVAEASSGTEAVELAEEYHPNVAVVDIGMKGMNGIEATAEIVRRSPSTAVLILTMHDNEHYVLRAIRAGAKGYLLKDTVEEELVEAIREVEKGGRFFSPAVARAAGQAV